MPITPIKKAIQLSQLLQTPVLETKPTRSELQITLTGYLLVGSYFCIIKGRKKSELTHEAADAIMVFIIILLG